MFPRLAARETYIAETNFAARKQKNVFLPEVIFTSWYENHTMRYSDGGICHSIPVNNLKFMH